MCSPRALSPLTKSSTLNRKGIKTAWSFLELWKTSHSILFQMTLATVLMAPVLGDCGPPPSLPFASPINQLYGTTFSTGTILKYACHHGFRKVNSSHLTCGENSSWVYTIFCAKKWCRNPGELVNGKVEITTDLLLGSTIDFSCAKGYLLIGSATSRCVVQGKGVDWSGSLPECVIVTCGSPPDISNGKHSGRDEDIYTYGSSVTYSCDPNYTLLGNASIVCSVFNKTVGVWSPSPPACQRTCCPTPNMDKIRIVSERRDFTGICIYAYGDYIFYICAEGTYPMSTDGRSSCQADGRWEPATPSCQGETQNHPAVTSPSLAETITRGNKYLSDNESSRYISTRGVCPKPVIMHGKLAVEKERYAEMENTTIQCDTGYDLVGSPNIICLENRTWYPEIPKCKTAAPEDCGQVNEGRKLLQCLPSPEDVKKALEVYKLSLEIERLEQEKGKWTRIHRKISKHVKIKGPFRPFG